MLANRRLRIEYDVITRIHRSLPPGKAEVTVTVGAQVAPNTIVGTSQMSAGFRTINLAQSLSVDPKEVGKYLQRPVGQKIFKGELLAYRAGGILQNKLFIVSPADSIIDFLDPNTGTVRLNFLPQRIELPAAAFGIVEHIDKDLGLVVIKTQATKIYGVLGSGNRREGNLINLGSRGSIIDASKIKKEYAGHIIIGGGLIYKDAITSAVSGGVNGIITGGINAKDYSSISGGRIKGKKAVGTDIGISVFVAEGFGSLPISGNIYQLLQKNIGKFAILDGNRSEIVLPSDKSDSMIKVKTTVLPQLEKWDTMQLLSDIEAEEIEVGRLVRVIGSSFMGEEGKIVFIDQSATLLPSGVKTYLVTLETGARKIQVPFTNIELI